MTLSPAPAASLLRDRLDHWAGTRPDDTAITFGPLIRDKTDSKRAKTDGKSRRPQ